MTENAVKQFAWRSKGEIGELRAELLVGLRAGCNGALQYRVDVLKQIVQECQDRLEDLQEAWLAQEGYTVAGHAVWNAYHRTWCRYRELQAAVIRQFGAGSSGIWSSEIRACWSWREMPQTVWHANYATAPKGNR